MTRQYRIGTVAVRLTWALGITSSTHAELFEPFVDTGDPDLDLYVQQATGAAPDVNMVCDGFPHWRISQLGDEWIYTVYDARPPHACVHWAVLNHARTCGTVWIMEGCSAAVGRIMEPLVQLILLEHWAQMSAYMIHALAVDDHGTGRVFVGHSGAGKSTTAQWYVADGCTVLSDERVVLHVEGEQVLAYGTPWPGMARISTPGPVQVAAIYGLHQATQHRLATLTPHQVAALIYPQLFLPTRNRATIESTLAWCTQLMDRVPIRRLSFAEDASVLPFVRQTRSAHIPHPAAA
jgi:hypothetical protein